MIGLSRPARNGPPPGGQGAKGSDGVTSAIQQTTGAIGYIEYSYAKNANLATVVVATGAPDPVPLTPPNVANGVAQATVAGSGNNLPLNLNSTYTTKEPNAYPIVLVTYEITCSTGLPGDQSALVKSFLTYTASAAGRASSPTSAMHPCRSPSSRRSSRRPKASADPVRQHQPPLRCSTQPGAAAGVLPERTRATPRGGADKSGSVRQMTPDRSGAGSEQEAAVTTPRDQAGDRPSPEVDVYPPHPSRRRRAGGAAGPQQWDRVAAAADRMPSAGEGPGTTSSPAAVGSRVARPPASGIASFAACPSDRRRSCSSSWRRSPSS